ncbi:MAG: hypothetical protein WC717_06635 [Candidatus Micrarchaeia archaeon]|jgi:hypothetical protein
MKSKNSILAAAVFLILACKLPFAEPILQISGYETTPSTVYAGTTGYVQLTLYNSGDTTATSVSPHYTVDGLDSSAAIGDMGAKSTAQAAVPFKIGADAAGTIQLIKIDVYYTYTDGSGSGVSKKTVFSIPLTVQQYSPLVVRTLSVDKTQISAGETLAFDLSIENTGGVVNNLVITMPGNSTFYIDGSTQMNVGTIPSGSSANVTLALVSGTSTKTGTYSIPIIFTYQDMAKQPTEKTLNVGPISVLDTSVQYRLTLIPTETVEIGAEVPFSLTLENRGSYPISGVVEIDATTVFTPIGMQRIYFDSVPAGQSSAKEITLGVSSTAGAGYYTLPLTLIPSTGQELQYDVGLIVEATPEITVTLTSSGATQSVEVANTGNSQIRSLYASVTPAGSSTATKSFIGTLDVDDSSSVALDSSVSSVTVELSFRDSRNAEHTVTKTLQSTGGNSSFVQSGGASRAGAAGMNATGAAANRNRSPLGMLTGPGGSTGGDTTTLAIAGIVVVAIAGGAGYFIYKKYRKGSKPKIPGMALPATETPDKRKSR